ncbi:MAG: ASKHA domain-containing protein [Desulfovibrio sp.]|uniref:ASKHA domain-containing protein n=1 Tax=Desulfovibrio sp. TaxID=885 RepID=UPI0039E4090F
MLLQLFSTARTPFLSGENAGVTALEIEATPGESLSRAIWLSGLVPPLPLCSGLGCCGRCRVRFVADAPAPLPAESDIFSTVELGEGWRLACRRQVPDAARLVLELPAENLALPSDQEKTSSVDFMVDMRQATADNTPPASSAVDGVSLALAVDLGTTSVYWRAVAVPEAEDARAGGAGTATGVATTVAQGSFLNPQAGAGADVMSRLAVAMQPQGRMVLSELVRRSLRSVVGSLEQGGTARVANLCVAANTAMTDIFLDLPVDGLCAAPYRLGHQGHKNVDVPALPPVYIPPLPAPFVGGDISAGLAALLAAGTPRPFVLADLGTNGELALVDAAGRLLLASVPLGPALEGIGPQCGQLAGPGVITDFSLAPAGLNAHFFAQSPEDARPENDGPEHGGQCPCPSCQAISARSLANGRSGPEAEMHKARGISATGYMSLLAVLLRTGLMREDGGFEAAPAMPLARRLASGLEAGKDSGGMRLRLPHGMWLCAADVEELLKVKAAFALALESLLAAAGLAPAEVAALCLAGALGEHVRAHDLQTLGFLPSALAPRLRAVGNASLEGAALLAIDAQMRENLAGLCATSRLLPLVEEENFHQTYLRHMRFGA